MNYSITESKLDKTIYNYIDNLFKDLNHIMAEDDYGNEMSSGIKFYIGDYGDEDSFFWFDSEYFDYDCELCPMVEFDDDLENKLNSLFGDKWHTPFKKWLKDNYSLDVKTIQ